MKNIILLLTGLAMIGCASAQVGMTAAYDRGPDSPTPDSTVQITSSGAIYSAIAGAGSNVHIVYGSAGAPDSVRYYRSTNEGTSFASVVTLNGAGTPELDDPIAADGSVVAAISINAITNWNDGYSRDGGEIAIRRSTDSGATWGSASNLTSGAKAFRYSINAQGSTWNIVWMDYRNGYWDIFQLRSTDSGATWGSATKLIDGNNGLSGNPGGPGRPILVSDGNDLYMVWMDPRDNRGSCTFGGGTIPDCTEAYFKHSTDLGATWGSDVRLTTNTTGNYAGRPVVAVKGSQVLVAYDYCEQGGDLHIGLKRSQDKGATWSNQALIVAAGPGDQTHADMQFGPHAGDVIIAWRSTRGSQQNVWARFSTNYGALWGPEQQISAAQSEIPALAVTTNYIHVLYTNAGGGALQYRRFPVTP